MESSNTPKQQNRLNIFDLDSEVQEVVDGRTIRHLSCEDCLGDDVLLRDGKGRSYLATTEDWEQVRHLSLYEEAC